MRLTPRGAAQLNLAALSAFGIAGGLACGLAGGWLIPGYLMCGAGAITALILVLDLLRP